MADIERIKERLDNIRSVEPIISSLRTISAGGWQAALRSVQSARLYVDHLTAVLAATRPFIGHRAARHGLASAGPAEADPNPRRVLMLVIASERGLCGSFNEVVLSGAVKLVEQQQLRSEQVEVATLGRRAQLHFESLGRALATSYALPVTRVAPYSLVRELGEALLAMVQEGSVDAIQVVYSPYKAVTIEPPVVARWLPFSLGELAAASSSEVPERQVLVETDPDELYQATLTEWCYAQLYQYVIESAAAEQSARFRAMEAATSNLARMIDDLTLSYHTARQHAITMEMLDLTAGSGILRGPDGT
jgi:F-type H+-transporting ATPase subunit gamma